MIDVGDTTQESPAKDPSRSICYSLVTDNLPRHLHSQQPTSLFCLWRRVHASCDVSAQFVDSRRVISLFETAQSGDIHALRGSSFAMIEKCQTPSSHVHPPSGQRSW